jgi:hypothetical protein
MEMDVSRKKKKKENQLRLFYLRYLVCLDFDPAGICFPSIYHTSYHDHPQKKKKKKTDQSIKFKFNIIFNFLPLLLCVLLCIFTLFKR